MSELHWRRFKTKNTNKTHKGVVREDEPILPPVGLKIVGVKGGGRGIPAGGVRCVGNTKPPRRFRCKIVGRRGNAHVGVLPRQAKRHVGHPGVSKMAHGESGRMMRA